MKLRPNKKVKKELKNLKKTFVENNKRLKMPRGKLKGRGERLRKATR